MELQEIPFELNRLYNLDSEKAIKRIPDKFFELAIIDPPYGIGENGTKNHTRSKAWSYAVLATSFKGSFGF